MNNVQMSEAKFLEILGYLGRMEKTAFKEEVCLDLKIDQREFDLVANAILKLDINDFKKDDKMILKLIQTELKLPEDKESSFIQLIQRGIKEKIKLKIKEGEKEFFCYPYALHFISGELTLVAEQTIGAHLETIALQKITHLDISEEHFSPRYLESEIQNFIREIRSLTGEEERLILKIKDRSSFNTKEVFELFINECFVKTPKGEWIWAATVEKSYNLYEWLFELDSNVTILEPSSIKDEYLVYKNFRRKKLA